jgi:F-type H+-transporting ATPase subunit b
MPRQRKLALGLAALGLGLALALATAPGSSAAAQEPAKATKAEEHGAAHPAAATGHESSGLHEEAGEPNILEPQPTLALWTVIVFLGLLFVLRRFAWKPLIAALHQREEHLEHVLLETERARNESEQLLAEHRRRLAAAEDQVRSLIDGARRDAQVAADVIVKKAQDEADASRKRAERDIATARDQALSEIWSKTTDLAVSVAGKVLNKSLTEDDQRRLIDAAVRELPAVRPASNGHGGHPA